MTNLANLTELFRLALEGQINRTDFNDRWKLIAEKNEFYRTLGADLDEAITHTPYHIFKNQIDYKVWQAMREYRVILCDYLLLPYFKGDMNHWLAKRKMVIEAVTKIDGVSEESIKKEISRIAAD